MVFLQVVVLNVLRRSLNMPAELRILHCNPIRQQARRLGAGAARGLSRPRRSIGELFPASKPSAERALQQLSPREQLCVRLQMVQVFR
jgi:hypothetical protein